MSAIASNDQSKYEKDQDRPPCDTCSPLECSLSTRPSHEEKARALLNRENTPTSATRENAVVTSMPFMYRSASTRSRQRSFCAYWTILFSMALFCASIWRISDIVIESFLGGALWKLYRADPPPVRSCPSTSSFAICCVLVSDVSPLDEQVRQAVLGVREVFTYVFQHMR